MTHTTFTSAKRFNPKYLLAVLILNLIAAVSFYAAPYVKANGSGITQIGCINCPPEGAVWVNNPRAISVDSEGNILVGGSYSLTKITSAGQQAWQLDSSNGATGGTGNGEFNGVAGIATDTEGNIYTVEESNHRVQKFDSAGNYLLQWGGQGAGNGQFSGPSGIARDNAGNFYVSDRFNNRVQKFDSNGGYLNQWGQESCSWQGPVTDGNFCSPSGVAVDSAGNVFVADSNNNRIQKFDSDGQYILQWNISYPRGIAVDSDGYVFATDENNDRIQKFDNDGNFLSQWGEERCVYNGPITDGDFCYPQGVTVDTSGNVYVADQSNDRIQKFDNDGVFIASYGIQLSSYGGFADSDEEGKFDDPAAAAFDQLGNIYVADSDNNRIQKFNANREYSTSWGVPLDPYGGGPYGSAPDGELNFPFDVTVDTSGNVYVADTGNGRIQKFTGNGEFVLKLGDAEGASWGTADGELNQPYAVAVAASGSIYVADSANSRVQKFDSSGNFVTKSTNDFSAGIQSLDEESGIEILGDVGAQENIGPVRLTVDSEGNVWAVTFFGLYKYNADLELMQSWILTAEEEPYYTYGVTSTEQGNIIVLQVGDGGLARILKLDSGGVIIDTADISDLAVSSMFTSIKADPIIDGRLVLTQAESNQVYILCDHDVSTNNCTGPGNGDTGGGQSLTYPDPVKGNTVTLILPEDVTSPSVAPVDYTSLPKDGDNKFPAGLTTFQFTTTPGATKTVSLYYDLPGNPSDYTARKYKTNTQTYLDVPNATITREDYNGKSMLKLTYDITDGGILDQDGEANGTVIDPVGLATTNLASTGENLWLYMLGILTLITGGVWVSRKAFR